MRKIYLSKLMAGLALVFAMLSASCTSYATSTTSADKGDFATAWEAADAKRKEASTIGAEWRDTGKMLKQAKKAAEEGDSEKAMKLVAKAQEQSEDAITQHKREDNLWAARVPQ